MKVLLLLILLTAAACGQAHSPPAFLVGWYSSERLSPDRLGAYAQEGVNLMLPYRSGEPYTDRWVAAAEKQQVQLLLQPDWRWVAHGDLAALAGFVRRYRDSPALYGWYLYDEPEVNALAPARLVAAYRLIKSLDSHPVAVVFTLGHCRFGPGGLDPRYLAGFDLLMYDDYPFYTTIPASASWRELRTDAANCVQTARTAHKGGPLLVLQAFGRGWRDGTLTWRDPSPLEIRCEFALAAQTGAAGVLFWSDEHADATVASGTNSVIANWHDHGAPPLTGCPAASLVPRLGQP